MNKDAIIVRGLTILGWLLLGGCAYNPMIGNNHTTGSPTGAIIGAAAGAGGAALLGGSEPVIAAAGIGGGAIGYYLTTLRYNSGGIMQVGGQVYQVGDFVGIYIPSDKLFEPNTADFLPQAPSVLDSVVTVLKRNPDNNVIVSGNTSGFARSRWEVKLSEERAQKVAAYLWDYGINDFKTTSIETRKLTYVGYGHYFPIANDYTNDSLRQNSRIQIASYPDDCDLGIDDKDNLMGNIGARRNNFKGES
jgi:outer membrane protein OmpA-like peptidoglycan-associated protein